MTCAIINISFIILVNHSSSWSSPYHAYPRMLWDLGHGPANGKIGRREGGGDQGIRLEGRNERSVCDRQLRHREMGRHSSACSRRQPEQGHADEQQEASGSAERRVPQEEPPK